MVSMKLCLPLLIVFYMVSAITDPIDKVAELIRRGNISELSKMFASTVEITIQDEENAYSKVQAGLILNKFFEQNKPTSVKMLHKVNSNPKYLFGVLIVTTQKGPFRIAYTLKETEDGLVLIEMRVESAKVK
jgi:hypothetical protein